MAAGDLAGLGEEIERARRRFDLPEEVRTLSCSEAGRDGFWLPRYLGSVGIENLVVDAASLEVKRRHRRVKTDRVDPSHSLRTGLGKLLSILVRYHLGERRGWSLVRVPSVEIEDRRHLHRELASRKANSAAGTSNASARAASGCGKPVVSGAEPSGLWHGLADCSSPCGAIWKRVRSRKGLC